jgi:tetratricopeptide (TPR) repeat protein
MDPSFTAIVRLLWESHPRPEEPADDSAALADTLLARTPEDDDTRRLRQLVDRLVGPPPTKPAKPAKRAKPARPVPKFRRGTAPRAARFSPAENSPLEQQSAKQEEEVAEHIEHRRFPEALEALDHALMISLSLPRKARLFFNQAVAFAALGREERALAALASAERFLDGTEGLELWLRLRLEQLDLLCQGERYAEAAGWLDEALELTADAGSDRERLRLRSLVGRIASGLGRLEEAQRILPGVREELLAAGELFEATAAGLDLGSLQAARGDLPGLEELTGRLEPLAEEESFPPAARRTVKLFCRLARRGTLTPETGRKLAAELRRAYRPRVKIEPVRA